MNPYTERLKAQGRHEKAFLSLVTLLVVVMAVSIYIILAGILGV